MPRRTVLCPSCSAPREIKASGRTRLRCDECGESFLAMSAAEAPPAQPPPVGAQEVPPAAAAELPETPELPVPAKSAIQETAVAGVVVDPPAAAVKVTRPRAAPAPAPPARPAKAPVTPPEVSKTRAQAAGRRGGLAIYDRARRG